MGSTLSNYFHVQRRTLVLILSVVMITAVISLLFLILTLNDISFQTFIQHPKTEYDSLPAKLLNNRFRTLSLLLSQKTTNNTQKNMKNVMNDSNYNPNSILFADNKKFTDMLKYYTKISSNLYPKSWLELNEQLFCPIRYSSTLNPLNTISSAGERILQLFHKNQFLSNCNDPTHKFLIFDTSGWFTGLGATFNGGILKYFTRALMSNRTFILTGNWDWSNVEHCQQLDQHLRQGFHCYFLPASNCNPLEILSAVKNKSNADEYYTGHLPKYCNLGDFPHLPWCQTRILHIKQHGAGWYPKNVIIDQWINNEIFANYQQYRAILQAFTFRLQPDIRRIIYHKVRNAFLSSFRMNSSINEFIDFDIFSTISFPIRASDKCSGNSLGVHGEMTCWTTEELNNLLIAIHFLNPALNTIIFTSEDVQAIHALKIAIGNTSHWKIIENNEDTRPSMGNARFRSPHKFNGLIVDKKADSDFEHDVIIGAMSSLLLQASSGRYVVHTKSSSWLDNLWNLASQLACESLFWSEQIQVNGFVHEFDEDRPAFLHSNQKKYHYLNRMCIELKQYGLMNKKVKKKHVILSEDLWDEMRFRKLNPDVFQEMFHISITNNGWEHYCDRYTKPPFELGDDVGV